MCDKLANVSRNEMFFFVFFPKQLTARAYVVIIIIISSFYPTTRNNRVRNYSRSFVTKISRTGGNLLDSLLKRRKQNIFTLFRFKAWSNLIFSSIAFSLLPCVHLNIYIYIYINTIHVYSNLHPLFACRRIVRVKGRT